MAPAEGAALLPIADALTILLTHVRPLPTEQVLLDQATGRRLALPLLADRDQPAFDRSAMDGVALATLLPVPGEPWQIVGTAAAGTPFLGSLGAGQCIRIYTGAVVPADAAAVVPVERVTIAGSLVYTVDPVKVGQHIARRGCEVRQGAQVVAAGDDLTAARLAVAAAFGHASVCVAQAPRVAVLPTGDELVPVGVAPGPGQIRDSNRYLMTEIARRGGAEVRQFKVAGDSRDQLRAALLAALADADVVVTCGGVSAGDLDLMVPVLAELGAVTHFHKIRIKPGKPLLFATLGDKIVLGLPGNPVSAAVCATLFLLPLLAALQGAASAQWRCQALPVATPLGPTGPRDEVVPLRWATSTPIAAVEAVAMVGSADVFAYSRAELLGIRPPGQGPLAAGDLLNVLVWPTPC